MHLTGDNELKIHPQEDENLIADVSSKVLNPIEPQRIKRQSTRSLKGKMHFTCVDVRRSEKREEITMLKIEKIKELRSGIKMQRELDNAGIKLFSVFYFTYKFS